MIDWLVQADHVPSALAEQSRLPTYLSRRETQQYLRLNHRKRRRDWLLGRWTAKLLAQHVVQRSEGRTLALETIEIVANPAGAPELWIGQKREDYELSISHAHGHALSAILRHRGARIGADIERVEPRQPAFLTDYFTAMEQEVVAAASAELQPLLATAIWSAKEAVLKTLQVGLRWDTRRVQCLPASPITPTAWAPVTVCVYDGHQVAAWWRLWNNFVLTLAVGEM